MPVALSRIAPNTHGLPIVGTSDALRSLRDPRGFQVLTGDTAVACAKNVIPPEQTELNRGGGTAMDTSDCM